MVFTIVGKTCSGKDTVAKHLERRYGIPNVVTYTTRPMRPDDIDGVSHHFITEEEMHKFSPDDMFAYTEIDGYSYFSLKQQFEGSSLIVYVLDPRGIEDLIKADIPFKSLYVDCPEETILRRAAERGTDSGVVTSRLASERKMFDDFKSASKYDSYVNNIDSVDVLLASVDTCMIAMARELGIDLGVVA